MRVVGYGDRRRSGALLAVRSLRLLGDVDPRAVEGSDRETAGVDLQAGPVSESLKTEQSGREGEASLGRERRKGSETYDGTSRLDQGVDASCAIGARAELGTVRRTRNRSRGERARRLGDGGFRRRLVVNDFGALGETGPGRRNARRRVLVGFVVTRDPRDP